MSIDECLKNEFSKCSTNVERVNFFLNRGVSVESHNESRKNDAASAKFREAGNDRFRQKNYLEALKSYNFAVAWAETKHVRSLAYSNRSQILTRIGRYEESLIDIDRALDGCSEVLKTKLLPRRRELVLKEISPKGTKPVTYDPNKKTDSWEVHENNKYGRHVIACKKIEIGDLLLVERPLFSELVEGYFDYCHECLNNCYNFIPCDNCPCALYCSQMCKDKAYTYHKYECSILQSLQKLQCTNLSIALKATLSVMKGLINFTTINKLQTHTEKRPLKIIFDYSKTTSIVFQLLKLDTTLFSDFKDSEDTFKDIFLYTLQAYDINGALVNRLESTKTGIETVAYAHGLYLQYSSFNHSCYPNAFFYHEGPTLVMRALGTINKGEQIFISYRYTYTTPRLERMKLLQDKFYFCCTCIACKEDWSDDEDITDFDDPFALAMLTQINKDHETLRAIVPTFIQKLRSLEKYAPTRGVAPLRQLVVECYQFYETAK